MTRWRTALLGLALLLLAACGHSAAIQRLCDDGLAFESAEKQVIDHLGSGQGTVDLEAAIAKVRADAATAGTADQTDAASANRYAAATAALGRALVQQGVSGIRGGMSKAEADRLDAEYNESRNAIC